MHSSTPPPRSIGRYVLYDELASGGMAAVHFGRLTGPAGFARPVAIKRLHAQYARDPEFVRMFLDEARLAARIQHPNVVPILDVLRVKGEVFLVMDYVAGDSLSHLNRVVRRRGERMPPLVAVGIVAAMLHGLHAAHEAKDEQGVHLELVHRDVSPQNALVGTDGVTRLIDFGIAKATGRLQSTRSGQLKGKLAYMAPEQVQGERLTRRADVYSASVILWETLTSRRLFEADNEANLLSKMLSADVPTPSSIVPSLPRSLDRAVLRGLHRDPAQRYETAREMASHIQACIGVASPAEIADWLERTVGDGLRERAARIESIERDGGELVRGARAGDSSEMAAADALTVSGKRLHPEQGIPVHIGLFLRALDNEYQHLQREECLRVARRYGFVVTEAMGQNDADVQRRQIEECLKEPSALRPTVILVNPVDEASLRDTALMAARAGVNWVSLNRDAEYLDELRLDFPELLLFSVSPDQRQVGRIHGRQLQILLPDGGDVFYIQGPAGISTGRLRLEGTQAELSGTRVRLFVECADWTIEGGARVAARWLEGAGLPAGSARVVCGQNDGMAIGARSVLLDKEAARTDAHGTVRALGCDGTPSYGQRLVDEKSLVATVVIPPTTGRAIEEIALWSEHGGAAPAIITIAVGSFPSLRALHEASGKTSS